jgi:hypothetical protein
VRRLSVAGCFGTRVIEPVVVPACDDVRSRLPLNVPHGEPERRVEDAVAQVRIGAEGAPLLRADGLAAAERVFAGGKDSVVVVIE